MKVALHAPDLNRGDAGQGVGGVFLSAGEQRLAGVQKTKLNVRGVCLFDQVLDQSYFQRGVARAQRDDFEAHQTGGGDDTPRRLG